MNCPSGQFYYVYSTHTYMNEYVIRVTVNDIHSVNRYGNINLKINNEIVMLHNHSSLPLFKFKSLHGVIVTKERELRTGLTQRTHFFNPRYITYEEKQYAKEMRERARLKKTT